MFTLGLIGPTASGKNSLGVAVAQAAPIALEIVSLDSMKVYRGMDIGTSKPTPAELAAVPHHLIDIVDPHESFNAAEFLKRAEAVETEIRARGATPFYVGGTGMYLHLLLHGQFEGAGADVEVRARLNERADAEGDAALHAELAKVDPSAAGRIHVNDRKRIVRALEVFEITGQPISKLQTQFAQPRADRTFRLAGLRWPREALNARIDARCREMVDEGWIDEVRRVRAAGGFGEQSREALGYREILTALASDPTGERLQAGEARETLLAAIQLATRQFAKRQMTWFRRYEDPTLRWFDVGSDTDRAALTARVTAYLCDAASPRPTG